MKAVTGRCAMDSLFEDLVQVLERQREILKEMLTAALNHNHALRQNDIVVLTGVISREEKILTKLKLEEQQRELLQKALAEKMNMPGEASLSKLLPCLPEKYSAKLSALVSEIKNIAGEITRLADLNGVLTRRAMHFNEQLLKLILNSSHNSTYQPDGKSVFPAGSSVPLINKTV